MKIEDTYESYKENFNSNCCQSILLLGWLSAFIVLVVEIFTYIQFLVFKEFTGFYLNYVLLRIIIPTVLNLGTLITATILQKSKKISRFAKQYLASLGIFVICAVISIFHNYFQILLLSSFVPIFCCTIFGETKLVKLIAIMTLPVFIIAGIVYWHDASSGIPFYKLVTLICCSGFLICSFVFALSVVKSQKGQMDYIQNGYRIQSELVEELRIDPLTRLCNRKAFEETVQNSILQTKHKKISLYMVMLDIDFFKKVNDKYGHIFGDKVLIVLSEVIRNNAGPKKSFRYGGEEFVLVFNNSNLEEVQFLVEKIRKEFTQAVHDIDMELSVTLSAGISDFKENFMAKDWLKRADEALYYAKEHGRNQIKVAE